MQHPEGMCREASQALPLNGRVKGEDGAQAQIRVNRSRSTKESKDLPRALFAGCLGERGLWTVIDYLSRSTLKRDSASACKAGRTRNPGHWSHSFIPSARGHRAPTSIRPRTAACRGRRDSPAL